MLTRILIVFLICILADVYIYAVCCKRCRERRVATFYAIATVVFYTFVVASTVVFLNPGEATAFPWPLWIMFAFVTAFVAKIVFILFDLIASIPLLWRGRRISAVTLAGAVVAAVVFLTMWWGALVTRLSVDVVRQDVAIENLPERFDGYTIAQISDLHVGTYGNDTAFVARLVDKVNSLKADAIVFSGDVVNMRYEEILPFVAPLSRLEAPDGVFAVLGNHDYGDYVRWPSDSLKQSNLETLCHIEHAMGWDLLNDNHVTVRRDNDSILIVGVENIGEPPFPTYGSLTRAYIAPADSATKILISHNPRHWVDEIADNDSINVALTLSGHTHAMQMRFDGYSPAAMKYPTWGGLYTDKSGRHQLYVNTGIGTVGFPMRLGATPEITLLTLRRK